MELTNEQSAIIATMGTTGPVAVFEARGEKIEEFAWIDKSSGRRNTMQKHTISAELVGSGEQVSVDVYHPRDTPIEMIGIPKGSLFTGQIMSFITDKGKMSCRMKTVVPLVGVGTGTNPPARTIKLTTPAANPTA